MSTRRPQSFVIRAASLAAFVAAFCHPASALAVCTGPLFADQVAYATTAAPRNAVFGDFNEDGDPDLAIALHGSSNQVEVKLNLGDGTFGTAHTYTASATPWDVATADFNEDGHLDLAVANINSGLSILRGNGDGTFQSPTQFVAGQKPFEIAIGDFDADGILDIAVSSNYSARVNVLLGLGSGGVGNGSFATPVPYDLSNISTGIVTGDLNGDGKLDLVATANYSGLVEVLLGNGDGTFQSALHVTANTEPFALALADLNEDGDLDIVAGDAGYNGIAILVGNGDGTFQSPVIINDGTQNAGLAIGDWNHDGNLDIASGDGRLNVVHTFLGAGDGTFSTHDQRGAGPVSFPVAAGDMNGDSATDLVAVNVGATSVSLFFGVCEGTIPPPPSNAPVITDVRDVPNDQGGKVFLTWLRSRFDGPAGTSITAYRVWRRVHPEGTAPGRAASSPAASGGSLLRTVAPNGTTTVYWEALADLPAQQLEGYGYTAATTQDSSAVSNAYSAFFVTALTSNPTVYYSSSIDSGYSIDNIEPDAPQQLAGAPVSQGYRITWTPPDLLLNPDIERYAVYRGNTPDFALDAPHRIGETANQELVDASSGAHYYRVTAIDKHDNEGAPAHLDPAGNVGVGDATVALALHGAVPHPARAGRVTVSFALPDARSAKLEMFDASGRRVASRDVGALGAGTHRVDLAQRRTIPAGLYFLRLTRGAETLKARIVVAQ